MLAALHVTLQSMYLILTSMDDQLPPYHLMSVYVPTRIKYNATFIGVVSTYTINSTNIPTLSNDQGWDSTIQKLVWVHIQYYRTCWGLELCTVCDKLQFFFEESDSMDPLCVESPKHTDVVQ